MNSKFIAVGENIHCTRIFKVGGKWAKLLEDGKGIIEYKTGEGIRQLPVPDSFVNGDDWKNGKVKHAAVAMWQGMYGKGAEKEEGIKYIGHLAEEQEKKGASFLDLNVDEFSTNTEERIKLIQWVAGIIQKSSKVPLSIDSSNIEILKAGLEACDKALGAPMVNSVSLEREDAISIAKDAGAVVIAGATGKASMPQTKEDRINNIIELVKKLQASGFKLSEIYIDPLVFPVSVDSKNGVMILDSIKELREKYGDEVHFAPGLSNISFGLPKRKLINQAFTYLAWENGCDGGIVNPSEINTEMLKKIDTTSESFTLPQALVLGEDEYGVNYISAVRAGKI